MCIISFRPLIGPEIFFWRKNFDGLLRLNSASIIYVEFKIFQKLHPLIVKPSFYPVPNIFISIF